ncbi:MAG: gamma-glutamyl-gamma-aminobutyrate hydrolase family protein, partial [Planctomycetales bacterium]|nr:gamma-glutamyl-gamma-aminobutyrate hydrolase family protein [Planctomycetales bacterium]
PPAEYGEEPHETVQLLDDDRFQFERVLCKAWIEKTDKPLLGICLGSQWINVASGGTLIQDIPSAIGGNHRGVTHPIQIQPDSRLAEILGAVDVEVNSSHHQAVKDLGRRLRITACSPDGVVEATESTDPDRFLIGVQWHPERMIPDDPCQSKLLKAFVDASATVAAAQK